MRGGRRSVAAEEAQEGFELEGSDGKGWASIYSITQ